MDENYALPFSDYIEKNIRKKYAIVITKSQYAIMIGGFTHEGMISELIKTTRPDIETDVWGTALNEDEAYENGNIIIAGYPHYMLIELPQKEPFSPEQFEKLKDILTEVKNYNDIIKEQGYGTPFEVVAMGGGLIKMDYLSFKHNIDELIDLLSNYVQDDLVIPNEVIIGEKITRSQKVL